MTFIWALIIGFIVGAVAKFIMPGKDPGGIIITILLGIAGSEVATFLGRAIGWYGPNQGARFIGSVVGAIIILAIYRWYIGRRANAGGPAGPRY
ncbi:GlsB/YeaQ/YmgE family stress response membrane protein [Rhodopila globiformis]|uniref:GlsB/YeaQ/YmgE family stress response membrane protein n=1 Tax=Rhodopila globiformis TaxID=1071 RepID=A0A2S6NN52_RHOGL|nr:GlsB/YeaQ/YmgE family stress response membrane protein [Rhodopila globiformis]PPQ38306.1 GlsB/YeaQ/YmgE family stress response membrane protein [Rhodopila globiformis]